MKKKVLNILPFLPWPLATGGHNGCYHSIETLKNDVDLYVLFPFENNQKDIDYLSKLWPDVTFIPYHRQFRLNVWLKLKIQSLIHKIQRYIYEGYNESIERNFMLDSERYEEGYLNCITESIEKYKIDIVQVEFPFMLSLVLWLPEQVKKVFVHHELRFVRNELILKNTPHNAYYEFYKRKNQNEEISLLNKYDQVITLSPIDRDKLIEAGVIVPCESSLLIVEQKTRQSFKPATNTISFLGSGSHSPNAIGLRWFLDAEWGSIVKEHPDIRLVIIGKWSKRIQQEFNSKYTNIEFKGFVEDLHEELSGTIMIVPLTIGSGIRIKILESTSLNVPFITTSVGVEGLPFRNDKECIIRDNTHEFGEQILNLLSNPMKQERLAEAAYNIVCAQYSKNAFLDSRLALYNRL